jgi:endonuclease/exonuclease/phosphatase family metal-dependent hydrolase
MTMADQTARSSNGQDRIRIATLNLWGRNGNWPARRNLLIDGFRRLRPDVVALQETITLDGYDQAADVFGPDFQIVHQSVGLIGDGNGIAIASRWPVGEVQDVDLHLTKRTADFPCGTVIAEVMAPEPFGPLWFVNHFPNWQLSFEYEREVQTVAVARAIEELLIRQERHVIVAGDFDAVPDAASIRFWTGKQSLDGISVCYRDAWESAHPGELGHTFTPENPNMTDWDWPFQRIDYILVRCRQHGGPTLKIASCDRIFDEPVNGTWGSDHFGVVADLVVP